MKRIWCWIVVTAAVGMGACSPGSHDGRPRVALVMKSLANEFFKTMEEGARAHQAARADQYELLVNGIKDEQDVAGQIALVEQMMARGIDALVIAPADSKALVPVCQRARQLGIAVVNIDNQLDREVLATRGIQIPFVGPSNRKGARLAGDYLAQRLQPADPVAIIEGIPNAFNAVQRKLGFEEAARAAGLQIVSSQTASWETDRANQVASAILSEHPETKGFLCANDSMALGVVAAIRAAGKEGEVLVAGFDNISAVQRLIREGQMLCTVDQHGDQLAVYGIEYALEILNSGLAPEDRETPVDLITAETLP